MIGIGVLVASGLIGLGAGLTGSGIAAVAWKGNPSLGIALLVGSVAFFFSSILISGAIRRRMGGYGQNVGLSDDDSGSVMRSQNTNLSLSQGDVVNAAAGLPPGTI